MNSTSKDSSWRFVSNHAHVLSAVAANPNVRMRDIAADLGITERTVAQILSELAADGSIERSRHGRRNHYEVHLDRPLRHPLHQHRSVGELIDFLHS